MGSAAQVVRLPPLDSPVVRVKFLTSSVDSSFSGLVVRLGSVPAGVVDWYPGFWSRTDGGGGWGTKVYF